MQFEILNINLVGSGAGSLTRAGIFEMVPSFRKL